MNDDLLNEFLLESFPNPERKGCPNDETLKAYAEDRLPPGNPVLPHISSCSECYREYRHYRQDWKEAHGRNALGAKPAASSEPIPFSVAAKARPVKSYRGWAVAAGIAVLLGGGAFLTLNHRPASPTSSEVAANDVPVPVRVDLFNAVTARGGGDDEPTPLEQVSLPSSIVNLSVTLPRFSESGPYQVLVSKDRAGQDAIARGSGQAVEVNKKVQLTVSLDLRQAAPGTYFFATVRGSDNGTYYYPLQIK